MVVLAGILAALVEQVQHHQSPAHLLHTQVAAVDRGDITTQQVRMALAAQVEAGAVVQTKSRLVVALEVRRQLAVQ
jgi:hypothetical protein